MKNIILFKILSVLIMNVLVMTVHALPGPFEGIITFKITCYDYQNMEYPNSIFPKELTVTIKGDMAKVEMMTPIGPHIEIINYIDESKITLIKLLNQKFALHETASEILENKKNEPKGQVQFINETREIAGYSCKKAIVTTENNGAKSSFDVWYSDELGGLNSNFDKPLYKDIKGALLEFYLITSQFTFKATAISIEEKSISSQEFDIPFDYPITSKNELKTKLVSKQ